MEYFLFIVNTCQPYISIITQKIEFYIYTNLIKSITKHMYIHNKNIQEKRR